MAREAGRGVRYSSAFFQKKLLSLLKNGGGGPRAEGRGAGRRVSKETLICYAILSDPYDPQHTVCIYLEKYYAVLLSLYSRCSPALLGKVRSKSDS